MPAPPGPDRPADRPADRAVAVRLRPVTVADREAVLALNRLEEHRLAPLDDDRLTALQGWADRCDVIEVDGRFGGFVVTLPPGTAYDSENYRWFSDRYGDGFAYLDRIALDPSARRRGVGSVVYDEVEAGAAARGRLALEVNLDNDGSLAFHRVRGFAEVGRRGEPDHPVVLMVKPL